MTRWIVQTNASCSLCKETTISHTTSVTHRATRFFLFRLLSLDYTANFHHTVCCKCFDSELHLSNNSALYSYCISFLEDKQSHSLFLFIKTYQIKFCKIGIRKSRTAVPKYPVLCNGLYKWG